jgi:O-antigen/teichoic acid export membrane protein
MDPHGAPQPERRAYTRRAEDHTRLLRSTVSTLVAVCGGLAVVFLFFAAMGAVAPADAIAATVVAIVLGVVWFAAFYYRHRTGAGRTQWRDRERRGF